MEEKYKPNYEIEYLLLHEILTQLTRSGMSINSTGSITAGRTPIYEFQVGTTGLYLGALSMLLNNSEDLPKNENNEVLYLKNLHIKIDQIKEIKYTIPQIAQAVQLLKSNKEVNKETTDIWDEEHNRPITLTQDGYLAYTTKKYLKQYQTAITEGDIQNSTLNTNFWMKIFTGILAGCALLTFVIVLAQSCNKQNPTETEILKNTQSLQTKLDTSLSYQKDTHLDLKALADSVYPIKPTKLKRNK